MNGKQNTRLTKRATTALIIAGGLLVSGPGFATAVGAPSVIPVPQPRIGPTTTEDLNNLVKFGDRFYRVKYGSSVRRDASSNATVKKISGGNVIQVNITTTPTGVYSTDGFRSRNLRYPGVTVEKVQPIIFASKSNSLVRLPANGIKWRSDQLARYEKLLRSGESGCISHGSYVICQ